MQKQVVVITGASSGMGHETALSLLQMGYQVYGLARRLEAMEDLKAAGGKTLPLDITNPDSIQSCIQQILDVEGHIDILVNNAGFGFYGAFENVSLEDARSQMEVNVFGLATITKAVLPSMREQCYGKIVNISSMGGRFTMPYGSWYHASKYCVEAISDSLRTELKPFHIDVILIEPGMIQTDWGLITAKHIKEVAAEDAYYHNSMKLADYLSKNYSGTSLTAPSVAGKKIAKIISSKHPKTRYPIGRYARTLLLIHTILPTRIFDFFMSSYMGLDTSYQAPASKK